MNRKIKNELRHIVGPSNFLDAHEDLLSYSYDGTGREFLPEAVIFPGSHQEISAIMVVASRETIPVVPRGAGSGMTGGALALEGGLVMAFSRLNTILDIDEVNQTATVEPGVITADLQDAVKKLGLYYPPDPASSNFCTIGGNAAECAGGPSAVKYGVTRDYIRGLQAVLPDGRIITTGVKTAKGVVGYDLTRLLVGSEGTLAIISKLTLRLITLPESKKTFLVLLNSMAEAAGLVGDILQSYLPCTMEYMDRTALKIVGEKLPFPLPEGTEALLLVELDGKEEAVTLEATALTAFLENRPGLLDLKAANDQHEVEQLWSARRALSPASFTLRPHKINEDVVVPRSLIPELVSYVEEISQELKVIIFTFGHAGDGNIHVNIMVDKDDEQEAKRGESAKKKLFVKVLKMGGTISGEHGVGISKASYLPMEIEEPTLSVMRSLKTLFDPTNILNPGKIFP